MNTYISKNIYQIFPIYIKPKQDMSILRKDNNILEYFGCYKDEKYILDKQE